MDRQFPEWMIQEYNESRKNPLVFSGPMRRCPDCDVRRNQWHLDDCEGVKGNDEDK